jgi:hypothetical protein
LNFLSDSKGSKFLEGILMFIFALMQKEPDKAIKLLKTNGIKRSRTNDAPTRSESNASTSIKVVGKTET